jgi:GT2 family glycosyltransferase
MAPSVLIIVLCHNRVDVTLACLQSLRKMQYANATILLIDNASHDDTAALVGLHYPEALVLETGENYGFAAGNNIGLRYAIEHGYDYALLLNNDTEVMPDFLSGLVAAAEADPSIGVAGPTIYYYDRPDTVWTTGGIIDWQRGDAHMRDLNRRGLRWPIQAAPSDVDFVSGCAMLCKRDVLERAGLLDERFFLYFEETEWCVRVLRAGYRIVHVPAAQIYHKIAPDEQADRPHVHYYMVRNRLLFLSATHAGGRAWLHTLFVDYARTLASWSLKPKWRYMRPQRKVMLRAIRDYFTGHLGSASIG